MTTGHGTRFGENIWFYSYKTIRAAESAERCGFCGAPAGTPCIEPFGQSHGVLHIQRQQAWLRSPASARLRQEDAERELF